MTASVVSRHRTEFADEPAHAVQLTGVHKAYGSSVAVDGIDLAVAPGEFLGLLGPSGCGKTTCLRMIAGFEQPDAGTVSLSGQDVTEVPANRRDVNTVFQHYGLFEHLSVRDNVAFGLRQRGVDKAARRRRASEALELVRLPDSASRRPSQLSGGQQQRVALARALVLEPAVLLLDEPLGALDLKLRREMQIELRRIHQEVGLTFVFVTHDQEEAMALADRIAVLRDGRVEQVAIPTALYDEPATAWVADFVGETNLLPALVEAIDARGFSAVADAFGPVAGTRAQEGVRAGERALAGVRPEDVFLEPGGQGTVETVMAVGDRLQVVVTIAGRQVVARVARDHPAPTPGDTVALRARTVALYRT